MEPVVSLNNQFQSLRAQVDGLSESVEPQFLQLALNFEDCRKKWLRAGEELVSYKEMLTKTETERGALEVKLKHARNQVDVEIRRRQKAEAVYEKLERQLQLIRELLLSENSGSSVHLSEEQRSALAFLSSHSQAAQAAKANLNSSRRLSRIDESASSVLSDISYDQTDDSLDWDSSAVKNMRLRKRQKRRSSRKHSEIPPQALKKPRSTGRTSDRINESIVAKTTITVPANGGVVEAVSTIETVPYWTRSRKRSVAPVLGDTATTDQSETVSEAPSTPVSDFPAQLQAPRPRGGKKHHFIPKTVIKSEFCGPCGKRTKFGKLYLRCQDCRVVTHPECRDHCPLPCNPTAFVTPMKSTEATLADFAPATSPMIPALVIYCIKEIERRGLHEVGLYRISGHERMVKELKEKLVRGKTLPALSKVEDINVITGVLKDFLRNLPEPLLTFQLNKTFLEAAEIQDDGNCLALLYQTIGELPQPNRDTLACLMIHLQKVSQSLDTKMDINNLARVFGPTLVGHAVADPDPMTILHDTSRQPRVVERLLSISESYWSHFAYPDNVGMDKAHRTDTPQQKVSILGPVTTPERQIMAKTPSSSSLSQRMTSLFGSKSKATSASNHQGSFFTSPQLK